MAVNTRLVGVLVAASGLLLALLLGAPSSHAAHPPKNGRIVFERGNFFPDLTTRIYSISKNGGKPRKLTTRASGFDGDPSVSPNGKSIAFDSDRAAGGVSQVFKMTASGKHQHALTSDATPSLSPAWSPDGRRIVFAGSRKGQGLYTMKADGSHVRKLILMGGSTFDESWSPDGKRIAFQSNNDGDFDVYIVHANGKHLKQLTNDPGFDGEPDFSPNGKKILFSSSRTTAGDIYQMNVDGSHVKQLTKNPANENGASHSPDGRSIVFSRGNDLFTATSKGKHAHRLTTSPSPNSDFAPSWGARPKD
jgi:Tol biopolymer transport system component